jgi:transcription antitermination factor NusG
MIQEPNASVGAAYSSGTEACTRLPEEDLEPRWYAAYTRARHEKRVAEQLERNSVESLLPLYEAVPRWKDRRTRGELPLFPGYGFVRIALRDRLHALQIPSVIRLVGFDGHPCTLPEAEVEAIRTCLTGKTRLEPYPYLRVGQRVRVKTGPLCGLEGILLRKKNRLRFVISLDLILRSVAVEIDPMDLE